MTETEAIRQNYELGVMAGEAREQQRIIKLLEGTNTFQKWFSDFPKLTYNECLIALIKGEK